MSTGNSNGNTKSNSNYVRAVSDFQVNNPRIVPLEDILEAYFVCRKNKRSTANAIAFEMDYYHNCVRLAEEINSGTYEIGKSICFFVYRPAKREVFAADFRDRIVHHYIAIRLEPLFEKYLPDCINANRKGRGTAKAVEDAYHFISHAEPNEWIYKADHQGFFYSIDKQLLWTKLERFINEQYHETDKSTLLWLTKKVALHCPQKNCIIKGRRSEWDSFPHHKSLMYQDDNHGLPIGDLPSQMFANFLLADMVRFLQENGITKIASYVDDFVCVAPKETILSVIPKLREYEASELHLTLHPKKSYIQHHSRGVSFLGVKMNPYRLYLSNNTLSRIYQRTHYYYKSRLPLNSLRCGVNSLLGAMRHYSTFNHRLKLANMLFKGHKGIYFNNNISTMKITRYYVTQ